MTDPLTAARRRLRAARRTAFAAGFGSVLDITGLAAYHAVDVARQPSVDPNPAERDRSSLRADAERVYERMRCGL